jgi:DNA-binding NarL/FixJ family response regulator
MSPAQSSLRVLLVDDHPFVRDGLRVALQQSFPGVHIAEAGTAAEALSLITADQPELVLLDVNLPGTNGLDLARQIHARSQRIKLLMVAGQTDPWTVTEALEAGASGFVLKTSSPAGLREAICAVLVGRLFFCPDSQAALRRSEQFGAEAHTPGPAILSPREREVLLYLAHGENTKMIASLLQVSPKTVESHRQHIHRKLGLNSVAALVRYAIRHGLTRP